MTPSATTLPGGKVRIAFAAPIFEHAEPKASCMIRQPTIGEYLDLGDPLTVVVDGNGGGVPVIDRALLRRWGDRLIEGHDPVLIAQSDDLTLAMLIEETILGFFTAARRRLREPSPGLPAPASPPATSSA